MHIKDRLEHIYAICDCYCSKVNLEPGSTRGNEGDFMLINLRSFIFLKNMEGMVTED